MSDAVAAATPLAALLAAVLGVLKYFNYRTKRDRQAAVGQAFIEVVRGLGTSDPVQRLASAILLRRFFDTHSEYAVRGLPYGTAAVRVIAGVLREEVSGNVQKVLADGLAYAPTLARADLQRTNLHDAYLSHGDEGPRVDVRGADFFRADLSQASLKRCDARGAQFYQATLVGTVLTSADLREANFTEADLMGAQFDGAQLACADFTGAMNVPLGIRERLDNTNHFLAVDEKEAFNVAHLALATTGRPRIFLSVPSILTVPQRAIVELIASALEHEGLSLERVTRTSYGAIAPLSNVRNAMRRCVGAVIVGLSQLVVSGGRWRPGTEEEAQIEDLCLPSAWNQIEAGLASGLGLPILVIRADCTGSGVFDIDEQAPELVQFNLTEPWDLAALRNTIRSWALALPEGEGAG